MTNQSPFDHRRDAALGELLREALSAGDDDAFVARVVAGFETRHGAPTPFAEVLAAWARIGVAAALLIAAATTYIAARSTPAIAPNGVEDVLAGTAVRLPPSALLTSQRPPDPNMVFASVFEP